VQKAIASSNTNLPTGRLDGDKQAFTIQSSGGLEKASQYRPIVVAYRNGVPSAAGATGQRARQRGER
jgi:HAE1 family hydrophobic/amphiphilic exporter-1